MALACSGKFGGYGAAIKRPSCGERKRAAALCPILTMRLGNSGEHGELALDGFSCAVGIDRSQLQEEPESSVRDEPFAVRAYLSQGRVRFGTAISALDQIRMR
jgi:hypothetical protein